MCEAWNFFPVTIAAQNGAAAWPPGRFVNLVAVVLAWRPTVNAFDEANMFVCMCVVSEEQHKIWVFQNWRRFGCDFALRSFARARHSGLSIGGWLPDLALVFLLLLRFAALATHATDIIRKKVYIWIRLISKMKMIPKHRGKMLLTCKNMLGKRVAMCACEQCGFDI